ncbi:MAG: aminotransferase class III-fold pyridoxal phosphate-dependent enzyme [Nitrospinota bacterium]|nr:MAG: aminotransferase class III-fold pyridoxal phosphate-dependent enzyme [Nitrospinota bacterium]
MSIAKTAHSSQEALWEKANRYLAGGTLGTFFLPPAFTLVFKRGQGSHIETVDGQTYIDYVMGSGPLILGHAHPAVVEAVQRQASLGSTFYYLNEPVILLAEEMVKAIPCAETVKFVSTGTEATFHALRIARAYTGRPKILKFEGGYHGVHDYSLMSAVSGRVTTYPTPIPDSAGIPPGVVESVLIAPFNDLETTTAIIEAHQQELAAVILEPLQRVLKPQPQFLQGLREITRDKGILLIFDEVVTGFRLAYGGAQEYYGVVPDLATYGKALTGGYPMAAIAGKQEIMAVTDPRKKGKPDYAYLSGTLNGNPLAAAAGLATLEQLRQEGTYSRLHSVGNRLQRGIEEIARSLHLPLKALGEGPVFQVLFTEQERIERYQDVLAADADKGYRFGLELLRRGLYVTPGQKFYVSLAHSEADIAKTLEAAEEALKALR